MFTAPVPVTKIIAQRQSCRTYAKTPLTQELIDQMLKFLAVMGPGPFGTRPRFELAAATADDPQALKRLGTYGFIKNPAAFILGAVQPGDKNLEDFGFLLETALLFVTSMGLGSCWLGGSFSRGRFSQKMNLGADEVIPAVAAIGHADAETYSRRMIRHFAKSHTRKPWETLFFANAWDTPLSHADAGVYATPLEMVRLAPSASNKQPWRVIRRDDSYHFYLQRTPGYKKEASRFQPVKMADLQRVDMGIALCHFQWTAEEMGLQGAWQVLTPPVDAPYGALEYVASWRVSG